MDAETKPQAQAHPALTPLQGTVELVKRGHRELLPRLREQLAAEPQVFRYVGDLGRQAQEAWAAMIAGPNDLLRESVLCYAEEMRQDLAGPKAGRLEKVAAERIAAAWTETQYFRQWLVQHPETEGSKLGALYQKRYEEADRRLERANTALANIKRLLPRTIEVQLLQKSPPAPFMQPTVNGVAYGDQFPTKDMQTGQRNEASQGRSPAAINRIAGVMNTLRNRAGDTLEPAAAEQ